MKKRENWAEKFERQQEEKEEFILNISKRKQLEGYNNKLIELKNVYSKLRCNDYEGKIIILEQILEKYIKIECLELDEINVKKDIEKLEEKIKYLKFKERYIKENDIEEIDMVQVRKENELREMHEQEVLDKMKSERLKEYERLKVKEERDRMKDSKSWEEYRKEEEEKEKEEER